MGAIGNFLWFMMGGALMGLGWWLVGLLAFISIIGIPWGKACFVGEGGEVTLDVSSDLLRRQVTLIGSWTFSTVGQAECARYIADRGIEVDRLFTHRWRLDQAEEAYRVFDRQDAGKGVILPN